MAGEPMVPFQMHVELLQSFLAHRGEIVEKIQALLNAQRRPREQLQDPRMLSRQFEDCFFVSPAVGHDCSLLRGQLEEAHWASGFRPRRMPGMHNDLVDPAEMTIRGFHFWQQTRWPGRNGRVRFAQTLFNLYVLRCLELLVMRVWDAGSTDAPDRLSQVQHVLDQLWRTNPSDQPILVRDARWLIPLAQSPTTDDLAPYFEVAKRIAESLSFEDRIEISKASVQTAGGHLRSQLRHCALEQGVPIEDHRLTLTTRSSNALDFAMLIQSLVPLLGAYDRALAGRDLARRLELAGAICQGFSADPELFVNRIELLAPYSMIEPLFVTADRDGHPLYTPSGRRHLHLLEEYAAQISRLAKPLHEDCARFRPAAGVYSPYGVIYGFSSNLTEHMALKTLQPEPAPPFSVEDVFADGESSAEKLAWVSGWRRLPHIAAEVQKRFEYPQQFAEDMFNRIERALRSAAFEGETQEAIATGRLYIQSTESPETGSATSSIAELPIRYIGSSDLQMVASNKAHSYEEKRLLRDRQEGMFLVSYQTPGGWTAITKDILTELLGAGRDVRIVGLPSEAAGTLRLMCPHLLAEPIGSSLPLAEQPPHDEGRRDDNGSQGDRGLQLGVASAHVQPDGRSVDCARDEQQ